MTEWSEAYRLRLIDSLLLDELRELIKPTVRSMLKDVLKKQDDLRAATSEQLAGIPVAEQVSRLLMPQIPRDEWNYWLASSVTQMDRSTARAFFLKHCGGIATSDMAERFAVKFVRQDLKSPLVSRIPAAFVKEAVAYLPLDVIKPKCSLLNRAWQDFVHFTGIALVQDLRINVSASFDFGVARQTLQRATERLRTRALFIGDHHLAINPLVLTYVPRMSHLTTLCIKDKMVTPQWIKSILERKDSALNTLAFYGDELNVDRKLIDAAIQTPSAPRKLVYNLRAARMALIDFSPYHALHNVHVCRSHTVHFHLVCGQFDHDSGAVLSASCLSLSNALVVTTPQLRHVLLTVDNNLQDTSDNDDDEEEPEDNQVYQYGHYNATFVCKQAPHVRVTYSDDKRDLPELYAHVS